MSVVSLLMDKLIEFLERDYAEEEVRVEIVSKPCKVFLHEGLVELSRGAEYSVPRWIAKMLVSEGVARLKDGEVSIERLSSIAYNEESLIQKLSLVKIPRYFYLNVKSAIEDLESKLKSGGGVELSLIDDYKKLEELIYTIGRIRVKKILNYVLLTSIPQDFLDKMSEEEKVMYSIVRGALEVWRRGLGIER